MWTVRFYHLWTLYLLRYYICEPGHAHIIYKTPIERGVLSSYWLFFNPYSGRGVGGHNVRIRMSESIYGSSEHVANARIKEKRSCLKKIQTWWSVDKDKRLVVVELPSSHSTQVRIVFWASTYYKYSMVWPYLIPQYSSYRLQHLHYHNYNHDHHNHYNCISSSWMNKQITYIAFIFKTVLFTYLYILILFRR